VTDEAAPVAEPADNSDGDTLVLTGKLFRKRRGRGYVFTEKPPEPKPVHEPVRRPARVAQMLAFAHGLGAAIERGDSPTRPTPPGTSSSLGPGSPSS